MFISILLCTASLGFLFLLVNQPPDSWHVDGFPSGHDGADSLYIRPISHCLSLIGKRVAYRLNQSRSCFGAWVLGTRLSIPIRHSASLRGVIVAVHQISVHHSEIAAISWRLGPDFGQKLVAALRVSFFIYQHSHMKVGQGHSPKPSAPSREARTS